MRQSVGSLKRCSLSWAYSHVEIITSGIALFLMTHFRREFSFSEGGIWTPLPRIMFVHLGNKRQVFLWALTPTSFLNSRSLWTGHSASSSSLCSFCDRSIFLQPQIETFERHRASKWYSDVQ